jgi:glucokinase
MRPFATRMSFPLPSDSHAPHAFFGLDIGGTKCAASLLRGEHVEEIARVPSRDFASTFETLLGALEPHVAHAREKGVAWRFGISCGGPLDASTGTILTPPNLAASWHRVPIVSRLNERLGGEAVLMNDANACALAEWRFGAGRGTQHMVFLTAGTGMGSGLILNGQLYAGATGDAGEIGHVRLRADGPVGYHKAGSVEGFTSGGGIARLAERMLAAGRPAPAWLAPGLPLTLKAIADAAAQGDAFALEVLRVAGERLGETLAIVIDLFNPERVVLGGFFPRCRELLEPHLRRALAAEALPIPRAACQIVPAELGETIGSHGAIAAALHAFAPKQS